MNRNSLKRAFSFFLYIFILFLIEVVCINALQVYRITPTLMASVVIAIAFWCGPSAGAYAGGFAGILLDVSTDHTVFYTIFFILFAIIAGIVVLLHINNNIKSYLIFSSATLFIIKAVELTFFYVIFGTADYSALLTVVLPFVVFSSVLSIPIYYLCGWIDKKTFIY